MIFAFLLFFYYTENIKVPPFKLHQTEGDFIQLEIDLPAIYSEGRPTIPFLTKNFRVRNFKGINVKITSSETKIIKSESPLKPFPSPRILSLDAPLKEVTIDKDFYSSKEFYPRSYFKYTLYPSEKGDTILELILFPVRYNPMVGVIEYVEEFSVEIFADLIDTKNTAFPLYFVIAPDSFYQALTPLIRLRKSKGYDVIFKSLEEISTNHPGIDLQEKIRNFLKGFFNYNGERFLLLVGDENIIPIRYLYAFDCQANYAPNENNIPSDLYYADLDGSYDANGNGIYGEVEDSVELYPDFHVGRIPAGSINSINNYITKLLRYEMLSSVSPGVVYINKYGFIAQVLWTQPYTDAGVHKDMIHERYVPTQILVNKFYQSRGTATRNAIFNAIRNGLNGINHDGHGWYHGMWYSNSNYISIYDVGRLGNDSFPFFLYSIGCWVGALDHISIAESLITSRDGAIAIVANSRYGWGAPGNPGFGYSDYFDNEFFKILHREKEFEMGKVFTNHKIDFAPFARDSNVFRWIYYQLNLLGDPALYIWRDIPKTLELLSERYSEGFLELVVASDGFPVEKAVVTLMYGDSVISKSFTGSDGFVKLSCNVSHPESLIVTVWKPGYALLQRTPLPFNALASWIQVVDEVEGDRDWLISGENTLRLFLTNNSYEVIEDSFRLEVQGINLNVVNFYARLEPGDTYDIFIQAYLPDSLRKNCLKRLAVHYSSGTVNVPLKIAWPSVQLVSTEEEDSALIFRFSNNSLMHLRGACIGVVDLDGGGNLVWFSDSIDVDVREDFFVKVFPDFMVRNFAFYFEFNGIFYAFYYSYEQDSLVFSCDFEDIGEWWGDTAYFVLGSIEAISGSYLTFDEGYLPFNLDVKLYSKGFIFFGRALLNFWFKYRFPTYGVTGVKISLRKEWYQSDSLRESRIEDLIMIGAGGALDEKSIYSDWNLYSVEFEVNDNPDSVRLVMGFKKDESTDVFWALDNLEVRRVPSLIREAGGEIKSDFEIISFKPIFKGGEFTFLVFSRKNRIVPVALLDAMGRQIYKGSFNVSKGISELRIPLDGVRKGVYFVKVLEKTKRVVIVR